MIFFNTIFTCARILSAFISHINSPSPLFSHAVALSQLFRSLRIQTRCCSSILVGFSQPFHPLSVNLLPVMEVEVHRQRRRGSLRGERVREERVRKRESCLIILLGEERRYTGITVGFRSQGVEQFVRVEVCLMILCRYSFARWFVLDEAESEGYTLLLCFPLRLRRSWVCS